MVRPIVLVFQPKAGPPDHEPELNMNRLDDTLHTQSQQTELIEI